MLQINNIINLASYIKPYDSIPAMTPTDTMHATTRLALHCRFIQNVFYQNY